MIAPRPFKYKCPKCGYSKIIKPKSDVFPAKGMSSICPKCKAQMDRIELNVLEEAIAQLSLWK